MRVPVGVVRVTALVVAGGLLLAACASGATPLAATHRVRRHRIALQHRSSTTPSTSSTPRPSSSVPTTSSAPAATSSAPPSAPVSPGPLAFGPQGTVYIADPSTNQVWARSPDGAFTLVAGNGSAGFSGMGGPATAATLDRPLGLVKIGSVLYIADSGANRVVAVNQAGTITVAAGNGATIPVTPSAGWTPEGGPALSTAIGPNLFGLAPGPQGSVLIATANEILELHGTELSVLLPGSSILGVDPRYPDAADCNPSGAAMGGGGDLYFVCENTYGLFEDHTGGAISYLGLFRSYGYGMVSPSPSGSVIGARGGDIVSIAHGVLTSVETFASPDTLASVGNFAPQYVAESSAGTFVADQSGADGQGGRAAIVAFSAGGAPRVLWHA